MAHAKLSYIDEQARLTVDRPWIMAAKRLPFSADRMTTTLENYYARRRREQADEYPDFYDGDLRRIFHGAPELPRRESGAAGFMRRNHRLIVESVSRWTGERKFTIQQLVRKLERRCESLDLRLGPDQARTSLDVAAYLATLVTNYLHTGKFKRTV